ncbi:peptidyl-prolyl cis-trans isomerase FKBP53-like [Lolium rigidum]|uniref:peptidyl-prolyl cis-trans isomerase FKBP53-like n=1 Tax=Lolium rigidum TaxID=89674 RepID=UPI001F5D706E|nr:peptidyl-prolyl cis-trans isomerase FKBP53-like [Lolium rigidum]
MSSFWGVEVKPEKPYMLTPDPRRGRLRLTQATLGAEVGKAEKGRKNVVQVQCAVKNNDPVYLCALVSGQSESCNLDFEFEEKIVTFSVLGPRSVHLAGYYVADEYDEEDMDCDTCSDELQGSDSEEDLYASDEGVVIPGSHGEMGTDSEDDLDYDSDYDSDDDEELFNNQRRGKSSVVIEEIQEDDKPAGGEGQKGSNKKQTSEDGDNSRLQVAVRTPTAGSLESEDEDGFPVSDSKSSKGSSKKEPKTNEDRKRKSGDITEPSGDVIAENDRISKKKKKAKDKRTAVDSEKVKDEGKEITQESSADIVEAKQKKKKNKKASASEADPDQQADEKTITDDVEEPSKQAAKKKKNKKKTKENNTSEKQVQTDVSKSDSSKEETSQTRTFGNGLIIQTVALGKPDGKKAAPGKKVAVKYIGKLKNGTIFDSTVGKRPFEFRLGIGQVIKGWDIGVNGMRIGDKRRLTIPPSMGYGKEKAGQIPPNSTLVFDVELMNVK